MSAVASHYPWVRPKQALDLDGRMSSLRELSQESPEIAKIVGDLEAGMAKVRDVQVREYTFPGFHIAWECCT